MQNPSVQIHVWDRHEVDVRLNPGGQSGPFIAADFGDALWMTLSPDAARRLSAGLSRALERLDA